MLCMVLPLMDVMGCLAAAVAVVVVVLAVVSIGVLAFLLPDAGTNGVLCFLSRVVVWEEEEEEDRSNVLFFSAVSKHCMAAFLFQYAIGPWVVDTMN